MKTPVLQSGMHGVVSREHPLMKSVLKTVLLTFTLLIHRVFVSHLHKSFHMLLITFFVETGSKQCYRNGTWNGKTDYSGCQFVDMIRKRYLYHVSILAVSTIVVIPAIVILCYYPSLRVTRVALHRNLLIAIFAKNIFMILSKTLVIIPAMSDPTVIDENGVGCRVLAVLERIATNSMYACMLVDGFYLHKLLVRVFAKEPKEVFLYAVIIGTYGGVGYMKSNYLYIF